MKRTIVNVFSEGREPYEKGTERLIKNAVDIGYVGDIIIFSPEIEKDFVKKLPNGTLFKNSGWGRSKKYGEALPHKTASHQFKSYAIQYAKEKGYEQVMWCDSSVIMLKQPDKYFSLAEEIGVIIFNADNVTEAEWTADIALERMEMPIEVARIMPQCYSGVMLFDFKREYTHKVFNSFIHQSLDVDVCNGTGGSTRPEFKAHRHDQSIITCAVWKNNGQVLTYGGYIWVGDTSVLKKLSPTFINYGIMRNLEELRS